MFAIRRLNQERGRTRELTQRLAEVEEENRRLRDENYDPSAAGGDSSDQTSVLKSTIKELRHQLLAVKWKLVEASRRAELAEASLVRHGLGFK